MCFGGVLEGIRTPDPLVRSQILYPTELQAHLFKCIDYNNISLPEMQALFSNFLKNIIDVAQCD